MKPKILLVNDDGIHAPGLKLLFETVKDLGDVTVVAPAKEQSGMGMSISMRDPIHISELNWEGGKAFSASGTPTDCVRIAINSLMEEKPDVVLSGINPGSNAGRNVFYSGTVGGAIESAFHGVPAAAISCLDEQNPNFELAAEQVPKILQWILDNPLPKGTILNVNTPSDVEKLKGIRMAKQGMGFWKVVANARVHPKGHSYYWLHGEQADFDEDEESDITLLSQGYMTAVPMKVHELTHQELFQSGQNLFDLA